MATKWAWTFHSELGGLIKPINVTIVVILKRHRRKELARFICTCVFPLEKLFQRIGSDQIESITKFYKKDKMDHPRSTPAESGLRSFLHIQLVTPPHQNQRKFTVNRRTKNFTAGSASSLSHAFGSVYHTNRSQQSSAIQIPGIKQEKSSKKGVWFELFTILNSIRREAKSVWLRRSEKKISGFRK